MIEYIPTIWIISALLIPVILIFIGMKNLDKIDFKEVLVALFFSFLFYFPVTFSVALYMFLAEPAMTNNNIVDTTPVWTASSGLGIEYKIFFGYIIFSLFLLWFADRGFMKILKFMSRSDLTLVKIK